MRKARYLPYLLASILSACAVYDQTLLGDHGAAGGFGGSNTNAGANSSAAGNAAAGMDAMGGKASDGSAGEGGAPDDGLAGAVGESGGRSAGGTSAGGKSGASGAGNTAGVSLGGASGGGVSGGGASNGGSSTAGASSAGASGGGVSGGGASGAGASGGGSAGAGDALVDDMQHTTATYANAPFSGSWSRVISGDMVWVAADVPSMFHKRADSTTDMSIRVAASCPASGNCAAAPSDTEVIVTLNNGAAIDVSAYTGVSFYVNRVTDTGNILRVAIEDGPSHVGSSTCNGTQADCGREAEYYVVPTTPYAISSGTWTKYKMPFSAFGKQCGWMCTRTNALNPKEVYSLRFRVDRNITGGSVTKIDYELDELYLYR